MAMGRYFKRLCQHVLGTPLQAENEWCIHPLNKDSEQLLRTNEGARSDSDVRWRT